MKNNSSSKNDMPTLSPDDFERGVPLQEFLEAKKSTTIRLKSGTIYYFQQMAKKTGIPYQTLINMYLDDCAKSRREIYIKWE